MSKNNNRKPAPNKANFEIFSKQNKNKDEKPPKVKPQIDEKNKRR